jgi:hypothetical protein
MTWSGSLDRLGFRRSAVLDRLDGAVGADRTIYVVNLLPNKAPVPRNMQEVTARTQNLQFANKTLEDVKMLRRIDEVAELMEALENLPEGNPLKDNSAYQAWRSAATSGSRESLRSRVRKRFRALGPAIFRPRQSNSARTKATNRRSLRCKRREGTGHHDMTATPCGSGKGKST